MVNPPSLSKGCRLRDEGGVVASSWSVNTNGGCCGNNIVKIKLKTMNNTFDEYVSPNGLHIRGLCNIRQQTIHFLTYKIVNKINGKYYLGKHQTDNPLDEYVGSGLLISRAVEKYGLDNFTKILLHDWHNEKEMNHAEHELVTEQIVNDEASYNLALGGQGGDLGILAHEKQRETWAKKSVEEKAAIVEKRKISLDARTPEQKAYTKTLISVATKRRNNDPQYQERMRQVWAARTPEQKEKTREKHSLTWREMDPIKKRKISENCRDRMNNMSKEQREEHRRKTHATIKGRTIEQQNEVSKNHSTASRKMWMSDEYRKNWHQSINKRTDEQKRESLELRRKTISNRTPEQNAVISKRRSDANKLAYQQHPERAMKHSMEMMGEKNPSFGRRWMHNPTTNQIVYAKKEDISRLLSDGYLFGKKGGN